MLFLETAQFRRGVTMNDEGFTETLVVIKEVAGLIVPAMIKLDYIEYRQKATDFRSNILNGLTDYL